MSDLTIIQQLMQGDIKRTNVYRSSQLFKQGTPRHGFKLRGVGITRKNKSQSKKSLRISKNSRRRNRG